MKIKALISLLALSVSLAEYVPCRDGDREAQEVQEQQEEQEAQEVQYTPIMPEPEFSKITGYLDDQVSEIWDEWRNSE